MLLTGKNTIKIIGVIIVICLIAYTAAGFIGRGSQKAVASDNVTVDVFFLNPTTSKLEAEARSIPKQDNSILVFETLNMLLDGPKNKKLVKSEPGNVKLVSGKLIDDTTQNKSILEVEFSKEYSQMTTTQEIFFRAALVYTMTSLDFIKYVKILVGGEELQNGSGAAMGLLGRNNININPAISPERLITTQVRLYFGLKDSKNIHLEERFVLVNPNQAIEKYIIEQLIAGPRDVGNIATIPPDTKIRSIKTDESTCYVNLSQEFKAKSLAVPEKVAIYSIVNSLTELPGIRKVQFLIDSKKVDDFKGTLDLSLPFERDETMITQ